MQGKESLERWYRKPDPWGYASNPDDAYRIGRIVSACRSFAPVGGQYLKALDVGAGEGLITAALPAAERFGMEVSDIAASRFPEGVKRIASLSAWDEGSFDLVVLCGVLYRQYDWMAMLDVARRAACSVIVSCNIEGWIRGEIDVGKVSYEESFPYRGLSERLTVRVLPGSSREGRPEGGVKEGQEKLYSRGEG